jgi:hypothetical protein
VAQDREDILVDPLGTDSINITVANTGNGFENYTLAYTKQTENLLVTAVNDSIEVAPGGSGTVEVFISALVDAQGDEVYQHLFTVRSVDAGTTVAHVLVNVSVSPVFGLDIGVDVESLTVLPDDFVQFNVTVTNTGNYILDVSLTIWGDPVMFQGNELPTGRLLPDVPVGGHVNTHEHNWFPADVQPGNYVLNISVVERLDPDHNVTVGFPVRVMRLEQLNMRLWWESGGSITPSDDYQAILRVSNLGNVPSSFSIEVTGLPEWLGVEITDQEGTLGPLDSVEVDVWFSVVEMDVEPPESVVVTFTLVAPNGTDVSTVVVWMATEFPDPWGAGSTWLLWLTMILVFVVIVATVLLFRGRR